MNASVEVVGGYKAWRMIYWGGRVAFPIPRTIKWWRVFLSDAVRSGAAEASEMPPYAGTTRSHQLGSIDNV